MFTSFSQNTKIYCLFKSRTLFMHTFEVMRIYKGAFGAIDYIMDDRRADSSKVYNKIERTVSNERSK